VHFQSEIILLFTYDEFLLLTKKFFCGYGYRQRGFYLPLFYLSAKKKACEIKRKNCGVFSENDISVLKALFLREKHIIFIAL